jgi:hypothetical protein
MVLIWARAKRKLRTRPSVLTSMALIALCAFRVNRVRPIGKSTANASFPISSAENSPRGDESRAGHCAL